MLAVKQNQKTGSGNIRLSPWLWATGPDFTSTSPSLSVRDYFVSPFTFATAPQKADSIKKPDCRIRDLFPLRQPGCPRRIARIRGFASSSFQNFRLGTSKSPAKLTAKAA